MQNRVKKVSLTTNTTDKIPLVIEEEVEPLPYLFLYYLCNYPYFCTCTIQFVLSIWLLDGAPI